MKFFKLMVLSLISFPVLSRIWGRMVRCRHPRFMVKRIIRFFRAHYRVDMSDYQGDVDDYRSLSEFFIRRLDPEKRPLTADESVILSPADGRLSEVETIFSHRAAQLKVKGKFYSISELIHEKIDFSRGWHVATIYLAPYNYHRFHYPLAGKIKRYFHTRGRLFPVNAMGLNNIKKLFVRNERIITEIEVKSKTGTMPCYVVAVGASFVGGIKMEFINREKPVRNQWLPVDLEVDQLEEMGRFEMGSTIVLVLPREIAEPIGNAIGRPVEVGQPIFSIVNDK